MAANGDCASVHKNVVVQSFDFSFSSFLLIRSFLFYQPKAIRDVYVCTSVYKCVQLYIVQVVRVKHHQKKKKKYIPKLNE